MPEVAQNDLFFYGEISLGFSVFLSLSVTNCFDGLYSMISSKSSKNIVRYSGFKILISLFLSFRFVSCSKNVNDVSDDSVLKTPLSKKVTECPAGTVRPFGSVSYIFCFIMMNI